MTDSQDRSRYERIIVAFSERFWADRAAKELKPLSHYLALFPEHEELIASEYMANLGHEDSQATQIGAESLGAGVVGEDRIGPFALEDEIGRGGQGVVYRAVDTRLGRTVALKILGELGPGAESRIARFRREAEAASKLDHPGICGVHDAGIIGGVPYIAMRFVKGATLAQRIALSQNAAEGIDGSPTFVSFDDEAFEDESPEKDDARLDAAASAMSRAELDDLLQIFEKAARALHAAHEVGVLHRDIKPGNIMVTEEREPVILDFGLAQIEGDDAGPTLTRTGDLFGTPAYMSPEQITGQRVRLDRRSDIYSLGVTLFECLTLRRPFDAPTREGLYHAVMTKEAPDPRRLNKAIPTDLKVVLETSLEKDRDRRYQTALDLAEELKAVRESRPIVARPIGVFGRTLRWAKRRPALAALTAALIIGLPLIAGLGGYIVASLPEIEKQRIVERDARVERYLEEGFYELHHGDPMEAVDSFEAALVENAESVESRAGLALAYIRLGRPESALNTVDEPSAPQLMALRAEVLRRLGRDADAAKAAAAIGEPGDSVAWFIAGSQALEEAEAQQHASSRESAFLRARDNMLMAVMSSPRLRRVFLFQLAHAMGRLGEKGDAPFVAAALQKTWPDDSFAWFWAGFALEGQGAESIEAYRKALELKPDHASSQYNLGLALVRWGREDEAREAFEEAIRLEPDRAAPRLQLANLLARQDDDAGAETVLRDLVALQPDEAGAHRALARTLLRLGRREEALSAFAQAIEHAPDHGETRLQFAKALTLEGKHEEAAAQYREAIRIDPLDAGLHYLLGVHLHRYQRKHAEAVTALEEATRLLPGNPQYHWEIGDCRLSMKQLDEAIEAYSEAVRIDPRRAYQHEHLAAKLMEAGRLEEAVPHLEAAVTLEPGNQGCWGLLAKLHGEANRPEDAIRAYERNLEIAPHAPVRLRYAEYLEQLGRPRDALEQYAAYLEYDSDNVLVLNRLAWALVDPEGRSSLHDPKRALPWAQRAADLSKRKDPAVLDTLAVALFANEQFEEAVSVQEEILKLMDGNDLDGMTLVDARAALEKYRKALEAAEAK